MPNNKRKWGGKDKGGGGGKDKDGAYWSVRTFDKPHPGSYAAQEQTVLEAHNGDRAAAGLPEVHAHPVHKRKVAVLIVGYPPFHT